MDQILDAREAKLKYGQLLRQQMKYDLEKKKLQRLQSTKIPKIQNVLNFNNQRDYNKMNYASTPHTQPTIDKKQLLQKQMEAGDFFPFGKRRIHQQIKITQSPPTVNIKSQVYQNSQPIAYQQSTIPSTMAMQNNSYLYPQNYRQPTYPSQQSIRANYHSGPEGYLQINTGSMENNSMNFSPQRENPISMPSSSNAIPYHASHDDSPNKKRNLLKYQNITQAQLVKQQLQKQKLQQFLKIQMEEAAKKKQQEKLKLLMENQKLEQDNKRYQQQMLRKQNEELMEKRRKEDAARQKEEEYKRNLQKAHEDAVNSRKRNNNMKSININVDKVENVSSFKDPIAVNISSQKVYAPKQDSQKYQPPQQKSFSKKSAFADFSMYSQQKQQDVYQQARLKNQTERKNQQKYFDMIKKDVDNIRNQIISQSEMYKIQMEKIKVDTEKARFQKQKSQYQFLRLKDEYEKNKSDAKLKFALDKTNDYYQQQRLRKRNQRVKTEKNYSVQQIKVSNRMTTQRSYDDGIKSLTGDSVKILLPRQNQIKSTIKYNSIPYQQLHEQPLDHNYRSQIVQRDNYDSLDNFVKNQHINNAKWNTISSVDSEITHEIQRFLQEQRAPIQYEEERDYYNPQSNISSVGKMLLRQRSYNGEGLNSLGNAEYNVDYSKVNLNNNKRLQRFKNLEDDGDLERLDTLLNNY